MKCVAVIVLYFLSFTSAFTSEYIYEFGYNAGTIVYEKEGRIPLFHPNTAVYLAIPNGIEVTYVKVIVEAFAAPKVNYDGDTRRVTISYNWSQISDSHYSVIVKGIAKTM